MVETTERSGTRTRLATRRRAPMKSTGATESRISMCEIVAIYEGPAVRDISGVVEHYSPVVPVEAPVMPSPAKAAEESYSKTNTV